MSHAARRMAFLGIHPQLPYPPETRSVSKSHRLQGIVLLMGVTISTTGIGGFIANHWLHSPTFKPVCLALTLAGTFIFGLGLIAVAAAPRPTRVLRKE